MEHTFNLRQISAFKVTLVYKSARARETISQKKNEKKKKKKKRKKKKKKKKKKLVRAVVADAFNPSIWEAEADRLKCSRPAWSTQ